ncbi:MAG: PqqD family protein [Elusimicrobia bacterium]|nr:PqqD family protein [Elusimicrobiota bacterium]
MDDEIILLDPARGRYYGIEGTGTALWRALQENRTLEELCRLIRDEFEVEESRAREDVSQFIQTLKKDGLLEVD